MWFRYHNHRTSKVETDLVGITALTSEKLVLAVSMILSHAQGLIGTVSKVHL